MARGRLITNGICADKRINELSDDTSRLAFTWLITFADCEGRTYGDPAMVRSMLFPRREDITIAKMEDYIREWAAIGLIIWYEADGDQWIAFPAFERNQPGLQKNKEAESHIPSPADGAPLPNSGATPEQLQGNSGATLSEEKGREEKRKEEKRREEKSDAGAPPKPLLPLSSAGQLYFQQFKRKRWATQVQREEFEKTECDVGDKIMIKAVNWAAIKGIADVGSICSAAKRMARQDNGPPGGDGQPPDDDNVIVIGKTGGQM